jgi:lambda family phage tail tape measure protein
LTIASLGQATVDLVANTAGFEAGMDRAERALKRTTKEAKYQGDQLDRLIGQIDPTVAAYSRLDKMEQQLDAHRKAGRLPTEDYKTYKAQLDATRASLSQNDGALVKAGMSAKATAAALRGVPAQFTDIATSIAAGQNPLTVFLQQGGQLKDMFGGIGPAAKALGGYVAGLINPFTVAAAAAAVLALAYKQGSDEATAFTSALVLSGNAAGTSSGQLSSLAQSVSQSVGTVGAAAAVLTQLAASGSIPASSFDMIAIAALKMQEATGVAAEETVKNFEKLAKDPVKASKELNDSLNYLTTSTYAQIEALQRQGDTQGAATLAEQSYAEALTRRAEKIKEDLGYVESAWLSVKNVAKGAWDAILDVGREATFDEKMSNLQEALQNAARLGSGSRGGGGQGSTQIEKQITDLLVQQEESRRRIAAQADAAAKDKRGIAAVEALNKGLDDSASKQEKLSQAYAKIDKQVAAAAARGVQYSAEQIAQLKAAEAEKYKAAKAPAAKAYQEDAGQKMLDNLRQQAAALQLQSDTGEKLGVQAQALAKFQQQIADIKSKDIQTADQKSLLASEALITAQLKRNVALEQEVAVRKQAAEEASKLAAFQENQTSKLNTAQEGLNSQLTGLGMGEKGRERLKEDLAIRKDYQSELDKIEAQHNKGQISDKLYQDETDVLKEALATRLVQQQDYYNQVDEASSSFFLGASEAWANYATEAADYSSQAAEATTSVLNDATSSVASGLDGIIKGTETVGEAFANLGVSMASAILGALEQIAAKWIVTETLQLLGIGAITAATTTAEATKTIATVAAEGAKTAAMLTTTTVTTGAAVAATATTTAVQTAAAGTTLAAWLPAALVASIGSFGAAAVVGGAALLAAFTLIKGFETGGYTGDGGSSEPAGIVHKGEYVFTKAQTAAIGRGKLEAIARNGYASGGFVTLPSDTSLGTTRTATAQTSAKLDQTLNDIKSPTGTGNTTVNLIEDASKAGQTQQRTGDQGEKMIDVFVADLLGDGRTADAMNRKFGLQTAGR